MTRAGVVTCGIISAIICVALIGVALVLTFRQPEISAQDIGKHSGGESCTPITENDFARTELATNGKLGSAT